MLANICGTDKSDKIRTPRNVGRNVGSNVGKRNGNVRAARCFVSALVGQGREPCFTRHARQDMNRHSTFPVPAEKDTEKQAVFVGQHHGK